SPPARRVERRARLRLTRGGLHQDRAAGADDPLPPTRPDADLSPQGAHGDPGDMRGGRFIALGVALLALPFVPGLHSDFVRSMLSQMGIAAIFALSFNMLLGQTGLLSFGHAVYFGLGGYIAIHAMRLINHGLPVPMPLVPLFGAAGGLL